MVRNRLSDVQILNVQRSILLILLLLTAAPVFAEGPLQFDVLLDTEIQGGAVYVATESFIQPTGERLFDARTFKIPPEVVNTAVAGYLFVTGESARANTDSTATVSVPVRTIARYQKRSLEILYHDVFLFDPKNIKEGGLTVGRVLSDVVNPAGKFKYSTAAATVVVIYKKTETSARRVRLFAGLSNPTPGDIYLFSFPRASSHHYPTRLIAGGGHGIKGNATGNVLNGITLSGGDDWDGSSGPLWDVDKYNLKKWSFDGIMEYRFGIDTILNWIYPEFLIFEEEVRL